MRTRVCACVSVREGFSSALPLTRMRLPLQMREGNGVADVVHPLLLAVLCQTLHQHVPPLLQHQLELQWGEGHVIHSNGLVVAVQLDVHFQQIPNRRLLLRQNYAVVKKKDGARNCASQSDLPHHALAHKASGGAQCVGYSRNDHFPYASQGDLMELWAAHVGGWGSYLRRGGPAVRLCCVHAVQLLLQRTALVHLLHVQCGEGGHLLLQRRHLRYQLVHQLMPRVFRACWRLMVGFAALQRSRAGHARARGLSGFVSARWAWCGKVLCPGSARGDRRGRRCPAGRFPCLGVRGSKLGCACRRLARCRLRGGGLPPV
mmetsp:Transcript_31987/g.80224  ORF Transcript_31987/g.80224 Transcript_31987/m.80224 type:complete len:317 (-) Transcript_31987:227-1177(-)